MAAKKKSSRRSKGAVTVNFSGVESGGRKCPDGTYEAEITSADIEESSAGNPMIVVKWKILKGKFKGTTLFDNISLTPQALWKLKTLLEALGVDAQEEDVEASEYAEAIVEQPCTVIVTNETYEGEQRPKVTGYGSAGEEESSEEEDADDEDEEEEEPKVRNKKSKKKAARDEDENEEDEEEDNEEADDEEEDEEESSKKSGKGKSTSKGSKIKEGSRVKFEDDDGKTVRGTVTSLDDGTATVEDKSGDEYELDADMLTAI